ncbi:hypothetical protein JCGZ_27148 [Jatropha curcas]|uniref:Uncharacterized protein n=1 Tax=Jatropha curcas TaxID=180498 RepID=A0A067JIZ5_JATCU|nr:hypothetical protein JCGZ_27148 [Jatropha curcas]
MSQISEIPASAYTPEGSASPGLTSLDSTLTAMRGIWRLGGCGGTNLANPVPLPDSSWRWIDFGQG